MHEASGAEHPPFVGLGSLLSHVEIEVAVCTGCGACENSCPTDVLRMDSVAGKAAVAYPDDCQACLLCEFDCPVGAIVVSFARTLTDPRTPLGKH